MIALNLNSGLYIGGANTSRTLPPPQSPRLNVLNTILRVLQAEIHSELSALFEVPCSRKPVTVGDSVSFFKETALGGQRK